MKYELLEEKGLSDQEFINRVYIFENEIDIEFLDYLDCNLDILGRICNLNRKLKEETKKDILLDKIFNKYYSYKYLSQVIDIYENPNSLEPNERKAIFSSYSSNLCARNLFSKEQKNLFKTISSYMKKISNLPNKKSYFRNEDELLNKINLFSFIKKRLEHGEDYNSILLFLIGTMHVDIIYLSHFLEEFKLILYRELLTGHKEMDICLLEKFNFNDVSNFEAILKHMEKFIENVEKNIQKKSVKDNIYYSIEFFKRLKKYKNKGVDDILKMFIIEEKIKCSFYSEYYLTLLNLFLSKSNSDLIEKNFSYEDINYFLQIGNQYKRLLSKDYFKEVMESRDENLIQFLFEAYGVNGTSTSIVHSMILNYEKMHEGDEDFASYIKKVREQYDRYRLKKSINKNNVEDCAKIINGFINSHITILSDYCFENNLDENSFNYALELAKKSEHPVYEQYINYINELEKQKEDIRVVYAKKIIEQIKNGIELSDGTRREYDLIDYYSTTNLKLEELEIIIRKLKNSEYTRIFNMFLMKYRNDTVALPKQLLQTKLVLGIKNDNNGNTKYSDYLVSEVIKRQAIFELNENNIPITQATYRLMISRIVNETLNTKNEKHN